MLILEAADHAMASIRWVGCRRTSVETRQPFDSNQCEPEAVGILAAWSLFRSRRREKSMQKLFETAIFVCVTLGSMCTTQLMLAQAPAAPKGDSSGAVREASKAFQAAARQG